MTPTTSSPQAVEQDEEAKALEHLIESVAFADRHGRGCVLVDVEDLRTILKVLAARAEG